jgi:hypothetical protein
MVSVVANGRPSRLASLTSLAPREQRHFLVALLPSCLLLEMGSGECVI